MPCGQTCQECGSLLKFAEEAHFEEVRTLEGEVGEERLGRRWLRQGRVAPITSVWLHP